MLGQSGPATGFTCGNQIIDSETWSGKPEPGIMTLLPSSMILAVWTHSFGTPGIVDDLAFRLYVVNPFLTFILQIIRAAVLRPHHSYKIQPFWMIQLPVRHLAILAPLQNTFQRH
jgi:hypothetical protein